MSTVFVGFCWAIGLSVGWDNVFFPGTGCVLGEQDRENSLSGNRMETGARLLSLILNVK